MRNPDAGPFGETFLEARLRAIVAALFVNNPDGGCVESVFTLDTHLLAVRFGISLLCKSQFTLMKLCQVRHIRLRSSHSRRDAAHHATVALASTIQTG